MAHSVETVLPVNHKGIAVVPNEALPQDATIEVTVTGRYKEQPFSYTWQFRAGGNG